MHGRRIRRRARALRPWSLVDRFGRWLRVGSSDVGHEVVVGAFGLTLVLGYVAALAALCVTVGGAPR